MRQYHRTHRGIETLFHDVLFLYSAGIIAPIEELKLFESLIYPIC